ncbi:MAG: hypothetical protein ACHQ4H_14530 [Ktedonobacterales bacterium]
MKMGRERGILRWEIHETLLRDALARAEGELAALGRDPAGPRDEERARTLTGERAALQRRLQALGPSPKAKMG